MFLGLGFLVGGVGRSRVLPDLLWWVRGCCCVILCWASDEFAFILIVGFFLWCW